MKIIDINCDVGEGVENEHLLMPFLSSCNIACGGHFGDEQTIAASIQLAKQNQIKIGAHPSFPDKANFGRKVINISSEELQKNLEQQLILFKNIAQKNTVKVHHVKPHGALYNLIAKNRDTAIIVVSAIKKCFEDVKLYVPYNSVIEKVAIDNGLQIVYEAFADRNYNADLSLVSRSQKNAVISSPTEVGKHVLQMIQNEKVLTVDKTNVKIKAATFCVHGDTPNALEILKELTQFLKNQEIKIA